MNKNLPKQLSSGNQARLFPSLKRSNGELIATSTTLAVFKVIPELLAELIPEVGVGSRTKINTYTEVGVTNSSKSSKDRPDGFIYVKNRNEWTALVESKVEKNQLDATQIKKYVDDARDNSIDAVITISNEFTPRVDQSPVHIDGRSLSKVKLYHLSWRLILSTAKLLKNNNQIENEEKSLILDEFIEFLKDDSVGNKSFTQMPKSWVEVCQGISHDKRFRNDDPQLAEVSGALIEEFSEIALKLTDLLGVDCDAKIPRSFKDDRTAWQNHIAKTIANEKMATCSFTIPNAANDLDLEINLATRSIIIGLEMKAPEVRHTLAGKISLFLHQIKNKKDSKSWVKIRWNSRAPDDFVEMSKLHKDYFKDKDKNSTIKTFTPMMKIESSQIFTNRKKFITELETLVSDFYKTHAQHLEQWTSKAPKPLNDGEMRMVNRNTQIISVLIQHRHVS